LTGANNLNLVVKIMSMMSLNDISYWSLLILKIEIICELDSPLRTIESSIHSDIVNNKGQALGIRSWSPMVIAIGIFVWTSVADVVS